MLPPNWVFLAIPLALLLIAYAIYSAIMYHREQAFLRAVYDGDRLERWRIDRHNARRIKHFVAHSGRRFY